MAVQLRTVPGNASCDLKHWVAYFPDVFHLQLGYLILFVGISQRGEYPCYL